MCKSCSFNLKRRVSWIYVSNWRFSDRICNPLVTGCLTIQRLFHRQGCVDHQVADKLNSQIWNHVVIDSPKSARTTAWALFTTMRISDGFSGKPKSLNSTAVKGAPFASFRFHWLPSYLLELKSAPVYQTSFEQRSFFKEYGLSPYY